MTTTVVAYTSFCDGQVTRFSSLRTSLRNTRARSMRPPAASRTVSSVVVSSATFLLASNLTPNFARAKVGRTGGNRTPNPRFWRPVLCRLSYCPSKPEGRRPSEPLTHAPGRLLGFPVSRLLATEAAEFRELQPLARLLLVLG